MNDETKNQAQVPIERASQEKRVDPIGFPESKALGYGDSVGIEPATEPHRPIVADREERRLVGMGSVFMAARAVRARILQSDDEFYEVFAEIRLP